MGMFSEIATASTVGAILKHIEAELKLWPVGSDAATALKAIGRKALTEFEWETPEWAKAYKDLFHE